MRALLACLVLAVAAVAAPPKDHEVKPGGFARLSVDGTKGATVLWDVKPDPIQQDEIAGVLVFTGNVGTEYLATAIVIDFDAKKVEKLRHTVRFGGPAPVPPGPAPGPDVPPLPPDNPPALRGHVMPAADRGRLVSALRIAVTKIDAAETRGDVQKAIADSIERMNVTVPEPLAKAIGAELESVVPFEPATAKLEDRERQALRGILRRVANSLEGK